MVPVLHPLGAPAPPRWPRLLVAALLVRASALLDRWARRVVADAAHAARARPVPAFEPTLEFYAEAGAMEGALYVDGRLVARLPGVTRL